MTCIMVSCIQFHCDLTIDITELIKWSTISFLLSIDIEMVPAACSLANFLLKSVKKILAEFTLSRHGGRRPHAGAEGLISPREFRPTTEIETGSRRSECRSN